MLSPEISGDYRNDRIDRCASSESIDLLQLRDRGVFLCGDENCLYISELEAVLTRVKVPVNEAAITQKEVLIAFDMKDAPLSDEQRTELEDCTGRRLLVTDKRDDVTALSAIMPVLYAPRIYGAGLENGEDAHTNESTNITDLYGAVLFLASRKKQLRFCVYYTGHGGCTVKGAKSVTSGGYERIMSYEDGRAMLEFSKVYPDKMFYFGDSYDGQLEKLHERLFECLDEFDRICRENDISYFLGGGSLLGAVRYGSIIPWDDDIDVMMTREEYERFLSVVDTTINKERFFFQSSETDPSYHSLFTKLRIEGTLFATEFSSRFAHMHQGVFIDIFVHDKTSDIKAVRKLHVFFTLFARSLVFNKWADKPMHFYGRFRHICQAATWVMKRCSMKTLERFQHRVVTFFDKRDTHYLYDGTGEHLRHGGFPAKWLSQAEYIRFGERSYPVPKDADRYLAYSYGDYKKPVPASLRRSGHDIVEFDFDIK